MECTAECVPSVTDGMYTFRYVYQQLYPKMESSGTGLRGEIYSDMYTFRYGWNVHFPLRLACLAPIIEAHVPKPAQPKVWKETLQSPGQVLPKAEALTLSNPNP